MIENTIYDVVGEKWLTEDTELVLRGERLQNPMVMFD
jgi:hypothetical protein